ncbi:MAG: hypothetical protein KGP35_00435 [Bacteroidetes bacterium]|nr:hypothetical protein [Bacteroidota bacterium]
MEIFLLGKVKNPSFFEFLMKTFGIFKNYFLTFLILLFIWIIYKLISYFIYMFFIRKLVQKDLNYFIEFLGSNYVYKHLGNGEKRYKWKKWLIEIKGNFDEEGRLLVSRAEPLKFFSFKTIISFK